MCVPAKCGQVPQFERLLFPEVSASLLGMDGRAKASERAAQEAARAGLSAAALADLADVDSGTVRDFLEGKRWPRAATRAHIEDALDLRRGLFELVALGAYAEDDEDEVERAVKASSLSRANQHKLIGAYYDMLEQQQRGSG